MSDLPPINFTRGVPAVESFPADKIIDASQVVLREHASIILQYGSAYGLRLLREWLASWHSVAVESVLCSNGSLNLIEFICSLLLHSENKTVFVEAPTYDRAVTRLYKHGAEIVSIPLQDDGPDIEILDAKLQQHQPSFFYIIPDFQNPAGTTCSHEKRTRLIELARQHGYIYLEDSPYRPLRYWGVEQPSLFEIAPDVVVQMSSFSKLIGPGTRMGYILGNADLLAKVAKVAEDTYITPSLLSHGIVYEFCRAGHLQPQIDRLKALYRPRLEATLASLDEHLPQAKFARPDGGFFLSITLPRGVTTMDVRAHASRVNLNLADGRAFFVNGGGERFLRLPYCALTPEQIRVGISRLAEIVRRLQ